MTQYTENLRVDPKIRAIQDPEVLKDGVMTLSRRGDLYPGFHPGRHHPLHQYQDVKVLQKGLIPSLMPNHFPFLGHNLLQLDVLTPASVHHQKQNLTGNQSHCWFFLFRNRAME